LIQIVQSLATADGADAQGADEIDKLQAELNEGF
jgi:hypothetical protein